MRQNRWLLVWCVVAGLAPEARAEGAPPDERTAIARHLADGEYEAALRRVDGALKTVADPSQQAALQLLRAQAFLALGQVERAKAAFAAAVQKDPTLELDAASAKPEALRLLEKVRSEQPATLVVRLQAGEADVAVDERELGPAPLRVQVPPGAHVVVSKAADGRVVRAEVQAPPGRQVVVELRLDAAPASPAPPTPALTAVLPASESPGALRSTGLGLVIGGGVVFAGGLVALGEALAMWQKLHGPPGSLPDGERVATIGSWCQGVGWVGVGVGAAAAVAGGLVLARRAPSVAPTAVLVPLPGGAAISLAGAWP